MKKILLTIVVFFATLFTNAQTLEGEWKFEKLKLFDEVIYFDNTEKDKENLMKVYIKGSEMGMKADKKTKEEMDEMKKKIRANKELLYASGKEQYKGMIDFKGDFTDENDIYNGYGEGKLHFNYLNNEDKIERVASEIELEDHILTFFGKYLFDTSEYEISLKGNKLILTAFEEPLMEIYYYRK